jgi:hypothetical protein
VRRPIFPNNLVLHWVHSRSRRLTLGGPGRVKGGAQNEDQKRREVQKAELKLQKKINGKKFINFFRLF